MPNAVTAIFGADSTPMSAEFAKMEVVGRRFGKTMEEVNAEENAAMLRNSAALKALIAERAAAKTELDRYNASLMANAGGLATVANANAAEDAQMLKNSAALKALNAERLAARTELDRYNTALMANVGGLKTVADLNKAEDAQMAAHSDFRKSYMAARIAARSESARYATTVAGGAMDARAQNALDQEAWLVKLAAAKGISVETLKMQQSMKEAELASRGISSSLGSGTHGIPGLNLVLRETLVIFREIGRGNWSRVPGSFSLILQGLAQMRDRLGPLKFLFSGFGAALLAVGVAAYFTIRHFRTIALEAQNLTDIFSTLRDKYKDLVMVIEDHHRAMLRQIESDAEFAKWQDQVAMKTDSVTDAINKQLEALREELELKKELAKLAGATDAQIAAMDQAERRQELAIVELALLKERRQAELDMFDAEDKHKAQAANDDALAGANSKNKDFQKTIDDAQTIYNQLEPKLRDKMNFLSLVASGKGVTDSDEYLGGNGITPGQVIHVSKQEKMAEAQRQLDELKNTEFGDVDVDGKKVRVSLNELDNIVNDAVQKQRLYNKQIEDLTRVNAELKDAQEKAKSKTEKDTAAVKELTDKRDALVSSIALHGKYDSAIASAREDSQGRSGYSVNSQQRIGAYAATPPDWMRLITAAVKTEENTRGLKPPSSTPVGAKRTQYGGATHN